MRPVLLASVLVVFTSALACAQSSSTKMDGMTMDAAKPNAPSNDADKALMNSMKTMDKDMNAPMTGDADKDFVAMMTPHHQGAVAMAKVELQYGKDRKLRRLAKDIVKAQEREIAFMKAWTLKHGG